MSGPAPYELVEELHRLLAGELVRRLKDSPSAETLGVARAFLKDQGLAGLAPSAEDLKELHRMHRLLLEQLLLALQEGRPSAAVFAEVRHLLRDNGIHKDLGGAIDATKALQALTSSALPFNTTEH